MMKTRIKFKEIGKKTLGSLVGFNLGVALEPLIVTLYCAEYAYMEIEQDGVPGLFFLACLSPAVLPMLTVSPFYGAARGAQIGWYAEFKYSLPDVTRELACFDRLDCLYGGPGMPPPPKFFDSSTYRQQFMTREKKHQQEKICPAADDETKIKKTAKIIATERGKDNRKKNSSSLFSLIPAGSQREEKSLEQAEGITIRHFKKL